MRKAQLIIIFTILLGGTAYFGHSMQKDNTVPQLVSDAPGTLPDFTLSDIAGKSSSIHELAGNKPTLFIYFNSTCHLCQEELGSLSKRIDEFEDYSIILTTVQPLDEMIDFANSLRIKEKENVHFLLDSNMEVATYLQVRSVPSIYCYDSEKQLVADYVGITKLDLLLEKLESGS
ncbi:redoxin domain-containing protein [Algoriphagus halophytocola]|uniref:Redoxin domain-containing protein n=1 Tax=Algoriphagus halophytocola TaxID=2991499 RepID=A0ABY6ME41_9BACT|nr:MULTISPECIES: redoxin domain-containing protein [unclassified Algoriphagus]UZD22055.1 redoxin domain-containing protein [Algoriphagus sp. TR-M5]WBL43306.1 redoxin domain-containing protein [Algoriphagus sp. TR-M9]